LIEAVRNLRPYPVKLKKLFTFQGSVFNHQALFF
jgi:hypothetical protein